MVTVILVADHKIDAVMSLRIDTEHHADFVSPLPTFIYTSRPTSTAACPVLRFNRSVISITARVRDSPILDAISRRSGAGSRRSKPAIGNFCYGSFAVRSEHYTELICGALIPDHPRRATFEVSTCLDDAGLGLDVEMGVCT